MSQPWWSPICRLFVATILTQDPGFPKVDAKKPGAEKSVSKHVLPRAAQVLLCLRVAKHASEACQLGVARTTKRAVGKQKGTETGPLRPCGGQGRRNHQTNPGTLEARRGLCSPAGVASCPEVEEGALAAHFERRQLSVFS